MPLCKALTNQISINVSGQFQPCCYTPSKEKIYSADEMGLDKWWNSDLLSNMRKNMKEGWDHRCSGCEIAEKSGRQSMRELLNAQLKSPVGDIEALQISLDNQCNIRCRMCNSISSSKWAKTLGDGEETFIDFDKLLDSIDLKKLRRIDFTGGEPFVSPNVKKVLKLVADYNLILSFSTNATYFPEKYKDYLLEAKYLYANMSIDGIGPLNDYIRADSEWHTVEKNILKWKDFTTKTGKGFVTSNTTVQAYNWHQLDQIKNFCKTHTIFFSPLRLFSPEEFTLNALPESYIKYHTDDTNKKFIKDYMFDKSLFERLKNKTQFQDKIFGTDISLVIPELSSHFYNM